MKAILEVVEEEFLARFEINCRAKSRVKFAWFKGNDSGWRRTPEMNEANWILLKMTLSSQVKMRRVL